jgi:protein SCO1/2
VGFRFKRDGEDFLHAGTVIFLTPKGRIVRYLAGLELLPFDLEMAVNDAAEDTPRSLMQRVQKLCFAYDPEAKRYTLQVNRIVLFVTLLGVGVFAGVLWMKRRRVASAPPPPADGGPA